MSVVDGPHFSRRFRMTGQAVIIDPSGRDIHGEGARIRANGPVSRIVLPGGVPAWSITGQEAAREAMADPRLSKDPRRHWRAYPEGHIGDDVPLIGWVLMENMTTSYGPDHARLRRLERLRARRQRLPRRGPRERRLRDCEDRLPHAADLGLGRRQRRCGEDHGGASRALEHAEHLPGDDALAASDDPVGFLDGAQPALPADLGNLLFRHAVD